MSLKSYITLYRQGGFMICKICEKSIDNKFYLHLNSSHKMKVGEYLNKFPEQKHEFEEQKPKHAWNKGLTAKDHDGIARSAKAILNYSRLPENRLARSMDMKSRYANGDILDKETRLRVAKNASEKWVSKIKNMSFKDRKKALKKFTDSGNKSQNDRRESLTPDDYIRLYPFAKGIARYHNCDYCNKQMIAWFGGKPRPKKRFCDKLCFQSFQQEHPEYCFPKVYFFYSEKMKLEFCLRSKLEVWFANFLENDSNIWCWYIPKFFVPYEYLGRTKRYFPDFMVNEKFLIELKSGYIAKQQGLPLVQEKIKSALDFSKNKNLTYFYWQFDTSNMTEEKINLDPRIIDFKKVISDVI